MQIKAMKYRSPAKVIGGISDKPHLIITNDVDHRKVTSSASKIADSLEAINKFIIKIIEIRLLKKFK